MQDSYLNVIGEITALVVQTRLDYKQVKCPRVPEGNSFTV